MKKDTLEREDNLENLAKVFGRNDVWSPYEFIKTFLCAIFLLPIRVFVVGVTFVVYSVILRISTIGIPLDALAHRPLPRYTRILVDLAKICSRIILLAFGFWKIKVHGKHLSNNPKVNIYVANHTSYIDILGILCIMDTMPSFVAKKSIKKIPLIGYDSLVWQCIYVDRLRDRESAGATLKERSFDSSLPSVVIFPEGTTSNGKQLITFHTGAFISGEPVRPVVFRYPHKHFSPSWESVSAIWHLFRLMTQFSNYLEITLLPVYVPSEEEKLHPEVYAKNVSKVMAEALKVPVKEYSFQAKVQYLRTQNAKHVY